MSENKISGRPSVGAAVGRFLKHLFLHNGWLKLAAVLLSIALWAGLISQDPTLTREKTFNNVQVNIVGVDSIKRNGFIVVDDLSEVLGGISITAAVPQKQYDNADTSAYNIRIDLSKIKGAGEQEVKLLSSSSATYGKVNGITPASVTVHTEKYVTRHRIPVSANMTGEIPTGWYISSPSVDPQLISVSGPQSVVNTISRAKVVIDAQDIEWSEGISFTRADVKLYNRSGEEVDNSLLEITNEDDKKIDSALIEQIVLPMRSFDTSDMITTSGKPARGYELRSIRISPEIITVAAPSEILDQLTELTLSDRTVNLKNLKETTSFQMMIMKPSDDILLSNETITVTAEIEPVEADQ